MNISEFIARVAVWVGAEEKNISGSIVSGAISNTRSLPHYPLSQASQPLPTTTANQLPPPPTNSGS